MSKSTKSTARTHSRPRPAPNRALRWCALLVMVLLAGACVESSGGLETRGGANEPPEESARETTDGATSAEPETITEPETATTPETGPAPGTTAPSGPAGTSFVFEDGGTVWAGELHGVVAAEARIDGSCWVAVGTLRPTAIAGDHIVSAAPSTQDWALMVDDAEFANQLGSCQIEEARAAGWRLDRLATVTVDTTFSFFLEFAVPTGEVTDATAVEGLRISEGNEVTPAILADYGRAPVQTGGLGDVVPAELPAALNVDGHFGTLWDVELTGLVPLDGQSDPSIDCYVALGTITPTSLPDGGEAEPFSMPNLSLIASGRHYVDDFRCSTGEIESLGYGNFFAAFVTEGTAFPFLLEFAVEAGAEPQALILGDVAAADDTLVFEPTILAAAPTL